MGNELPSLALGSAAGGRLSVDLDDERGLTTAEPVFQLDLSLPANATVAGIGARVQIRFVHPPEPIAVRAIRGLRRLFLGKLDA